MMPAATKSAPANLRFERAVAGDANMLITVQNAAFHDDFLAYGECPAYQEPLAEMERQIQTRIVYKILDDTTVIGDIIARKLEEGKYYLRVLCVAPAYQNQGIGQKALDFLFREYHDAVSWELITPHKSIRNHHLYEKMGFRKIDEHRQSPSLVLFAYRKMSRPQDFECFQR